jgi:hypothetical protein
MISLGGQKSLSDKLLTHVIASFRWLSSVVTSPEDGIFVSMKGNAVGWRLGYYFVVRVVVYDPSESGFMEFHKNDGQSHPSAEYAEVNYSLFLN